MSRWLYLAIALVACLSLRTATSLADEKTGAPPPTVAEAADLMLKMNKELKANTDEIKALKDELGAAKKNFELFSQEITRLKEHLQTRPKEAPATQKDLAAVWDAVEKLGNDIKTLSANAQRSSAYGPPDTKVEKRDPAAPGQIRLINSWNRTVGVTLDGVDYVIRPGQARTITRSPGSFTYEVHDVQGPKTVTLSSDGRPQVIEILGR